MSGAFARRCQRGAAVLFAAASVWSPGCSEPVAITNSVSPPIDASVRVDAATAAPTGDSLPMGAISLFNRKSCPSGWTPLDAANGRTLVPTVAAQAPGATSGKPLDDGEDRQHGHGMPVSLNLPSVNYAGIVGEANHGVARAGSIPLTVTASKASAGLPYVQLLACQKQVPQDVSQRAVPVGTLMFFMSPECPQGWGQSGSTQGRILVGVPDGATAGQRFGAAAALNASAKLTHKHPFGGAITTTNHGIALASGGGAGGYGKDGRHPYEGTSEETEAELPYLQLLHCQKL